MQRDILNNARTKIPPARAKRPRGFQCCYSGRVTRLLTNFWASFPADTIPCRCETHLLIVIGQETCSAITRGMPRGLLKSGAKTRKRGDILHRRWRDTLYKEASPFIREDLVQKVATKYLTVLCRGVQRRKSNFPTSNRRKQLLIAAYRNYRIRCALGRSNISIKLDSSPLARVVYRTRLDKFSRNKLIYMYIYVCHKCVEKNFIAAICIWCCSILG